MDGKSTPNTAHDWLNISRTANRNAEYLMAYDNAMSGLQHFPNDPQLRFHAVLALARSGAVERAAETFRLLKLDGSDDEDIAALGARILKDRYFSSNKNRDPSIAAMSADRYESVFKITGDYYPAINAASMWLFAGQKERAAALARETLKICQRHKDLQGDDLYWLQATKAEALLLLQDQIGAKTQLENIANLRDKHISDLASTSIQLKRICDFLALDCKFLQLLKLPGVLHYTGHMIAPPDGYGRFAASSEQLVAAKINNKLAELDIGFGYGSLACGGDILVAEALLQRGAELHLVFPFVLDEFKKISVAGGGAVWLDRFEACYKQAHSITFASEDSYLGDSMIFAYTTRIAMGLAKIRAQNLNSLPSQLAIWDGRASSGVAGTAADVSYWRQHNKLSSHVIEPGPPATGPTKPSQSHKHEKKLPKRALVPVLFTDMKDFSRFREEEVIIFVEEVMGKLAKTINRHQDGILYRNTWGDAIFLVFADIATAINCVLELQSCLLQIPFDKIGLPANTGMRMAMHIGPAFESYDQILEKKAYFGSTLTKAARMEPCTPVGEIYVSDAFAALAAFEGPKYVRCEYVGHMPTAKNFGNMRMFHLKKT